jgi:hypothetical protein
MKTMRGLKGLVVAAMTAASAVLAGCSVEEITNGDIGSHVCFIGENGKIQVLSRGGQITTPSETTDFGDGTCLVGNEKLVLKSDRGAAEAYFRTPPIAPVHVYPSTLSNG